MTETTEVVLEEAPAPTAEDVQINPNPAETAPAAPIIEPEEGLEALKQQLEAAKAEAERDKQARLSAERQAQAARDAERSAKREVQDTNLSLVTNAIETVKQTGEVLEGQYAEAAAAGDWAAAAKVQRQMSANEAKLLQLTQGKEAMEAQAKHPLEPERRADDPVEALASQLTPRSAAWVRAHPQFAREPRLYQKMIAAHNLATADGLEPDSDDYFAAIETTVGVRQRDVGRGDDDARSEAAQPIARRSAPPAAPVSRSGNGTGGGRQNSVRLTPDEIEMAEMMGLTKEEYARNKVALQKEGRLH